MVTRFRCAVNGPLDSMVATSPRSWVTFPMMRTVRFVKLSRYSDVIRGVEIDSAIFPLGFYFSSVSRFLEAAFSGGERRVE